MLWFERLTKLIYKKYAFSILAVIIFTVYTFQTFKCSSGWEGVSTENRKIQSVNLSALSLVSSPEVPRVQFIIQNPEDLSVENISNSSKESKYLHLEEDYTKPVRRLPDALVIGVKKCGTRALLEFLRIHPDVRAAGSEVHFFDKFYYKGINWYRRRMPPTLEGQVTMEKTPSYFVTKEAPARVWNMNPNTKLLVVVRDPVTRAISDFTQGASKKKNHGLSEDFEKLVFVADTSVVDTGWGPVRLGLYCHYLQHWLQHFNLSQILFVSGERLVSDPAAQMAIVQDFLGLKRVITEKHFYFNATKGFPCLLKSERRPTPHCLGRTKGRNHPSIRPSVLETLRSFYRPFNLRFYKMTHVDFGWP